MEGLEDLSSEWLRDRRVLVTGHTGFKGSWLSLWLARRGAQVTGLALDPPTEPSLYRLAGVGKVVRSLRGDIRDLARVRAVVREAEPEIVLHLAAQPLVRLSYETPVETFATNVLGTVHVLEAVRECAATRAVVCVTSDKCYENRERLEGYREDEPMGGHDPYSASKGAAEIAVASYRRSFFASKTPRVGIASARAGNVIGGGDYALDRVVPDTLRAYDAGRPVQLRNPRATRPWQHVLDPLAGYLRLAERLLEAPDAYAEGWNFGPAGEGHATVSDVVERLGARLGVRPAWELAPGGGPHEARVLGLDCTKAREKLGVSARLTLDDAVTWTAEWHRDVREGGDARAACERQIDRFEELSR